MCRRPPRFTPRYSSAASDVYKRQIGPRPVTIHPRATGPTPNQPTQQGGAARALVFVIALDGLLDLGPCFLLDNRLPTTLSDDDVFSGQQPGVSRVAEHRPHPVDVPLATANGRHLALVQRPDTGVHGRAVQNIPVHLANDVGLARDDGNPCLLYT